MPAPRVYAAQAIVLRRINLGETDKILTLLTREKGKLNAVAKGARRPTSRLAGATELFGQCRMLLAVGQSLDVVTQVEVRQAFPRLRASLEGIAVASYAAELADHFTEERLPHPEIYDLLLDALGVLDAGAPSGLTALAFTLQMLAVSGYTPALEVCARCRGHTDALAAFSPALGGAVCRMCRTAVKDAMATSQATLDAARAMLAWPLSDVTRLEISPKARAQLFRIIRPFLAYRSDRPLRSTRFLDEILAARALEDRLVR